jgi:hypothetical protein
MCKFKKGQEVIHKKGQEVIHKKGGRYVVIAQPSDPRRLEYCDEPFYEYQCLLDKTIWIRRQSEFEDGRFTENNCLITT